MQNEDTSAENAPNPLFLFAEWTEPTETGAECRQMGMDDRWMKVENQEVQWGKGTVSMKMCFRLQKEAPLTPPAEGMGWEVITVLGGRGAGSLSKPMVDHCGSYV